MTSSVCAKSSSVSPGKPDDDVRGQRAVRDVLADERHAVRKRSRSYVRRIALRIRDEPAWSGRWTCSHTEASSAWARTTSSFMSCGCGRRVADSVDALDGVHRVQELGERAAVGPQVAAVGVDVLAEQRHLAHAVGGQALALGDDVRERPRDLAPARARHDAVRAAHVAADGDLHPRLRVAPRFIGRSPAKPSNSK
jgi:hypothetical protein